MKKRYVFFVLFSLISLVAVSQQPDDIVSIREKYQRAKRVIETLHSVPSNKAELYCDYMQVNVNAASWPATGNYRENIWYYYNREYDNNYRDNPLVFVSKTTEASANYAQEEFLFDNGMLIFSYYKSHYDDGLEKRAYFKEGKLIRYMEGTAIITPNDLQEESLWGIGVRVYESFRNPLPY